MRKHKSRYALRNGGFTLIELLIVIGIIAILSTVVLVALNPPEAFKQSRDAVRATEIGGIVKAVRFFQLDKPNTSYGDPFTVYISVPAAQNNCSDVVSGLPELAPGWAYHCVGADALRNTDGTGWIPLDFNHLPSGASYGALPVDPLNVPPYFYAYIPGDVITAEFESQKYKTVSLGDGGSDPSRVERGSSLELWDIAVSSTPSLAVRLEWDAALDPPPDPSGIQKYEVFRTETSGSGYGSTIGEVAQNACSGSYPTGICTFTDATVSHGKTYYYIVGAIDVAGNQGAYSSETNPPAVVP